MAKAQYRVKNWREYNAALIRRGALTLWLPDHIDEYWYSKEEPELQGRPLLYSDACIECILTIRACLGLTLRATQGYVQTLCKMLGFKVKVPSYTQLSRRAGALSLKLKSMRKIGPLDLVIDSTGFKVYGEGEWKVRSHGKQKRRTWRKYHLALDPQTHQVLAMELTECTVHDSHVVKPLLESITGKVRKVFADGAYYNKAALDEIAKRGAEAVIPPSKAAKIRQTNPSPGQFERNRILRERRAAGSKKAWKRSSGYHRRSLVETHNSRFKSYFSDRLQNRKMSTQKTEMLIKVNALNRMTAMGMPRSEKILA